MSGGGAANLPGPGLPQNSNVPLEVWRRLQMVENRLVQVIAHLKKFSDRLEQISLTYVDLNGEPEQYIDVPKGYEITRLKVRVERPDDNRYIIRFRVDKNLEMRKTLGRSESADSNSVYVDRLPENQRLPGTSQWQCKRYYQNQFIPTRSATTNECYVQDETTMRLYMTSSGVLNNNNKRIQGCVRTRLPQRLQDFQNIHTDLDRIYLMFEQFNLDQMAEKAQLQERYTNIFERYRVALKLYEYILEKLNLVRQHQNTALNLNYTDAHSYI